MEQKLYQRFKGSTQELLDIIASVGEEKLNVVPTDGDWSIGQVADHLLKSYDIADVLDKKATPTNRPADQKEEMIKHLFLDFNIKMKSPEAIRPASDPINKTQLLSALKGRFKQFEEIIRNQDLTLICLDGEIPEFGEFSRLEWIYFTLYHTQRHIHQIKQTLERVAG